MTEQTPSSATETMTVQDQCLTFLLHDGAVRGRVVRLDKTLGDILDRHNYPLPVATLLAEMASLTVVLAFAMKFDGVFTLQARGNGPIRMMVADVTSDGAVRASASFDADAVAALKLDDGQPSLPRLLGEGQLVFTVDLEGTMEGATNRYQGIVPMEDSSLSECIHRYFRQSEQLETAVKVACTQDAEHGWLGGAVMIQRMPRIAGETRSDEDMEDLFRTAVVLLSSLTDKELLTPDLSSEDLLYRLYHMEELGVAAEARALNFACRCSREKVEIALQGYSLDDLADMKNDDGKVSAVCQFCSTEYLFSDEDIVTLNKPKD